MSKNSFLFLFIILPFTTKKSKICLSYFCASPGSKSGAYFGVCEHFAIRLFVQKEPIRITFSLSKDHESQSRATPPWLALALELELVLEQVQRQPLPPSST